MSVKNAEWVNRYVQRVQDIARSLEALQRFADSLPAPDENNELEALHYGHLASVGEISYQLRDLADAAKEVNDSR